GYNRSFLRF
uniref:FMRFamide-like neuropeptide n=1 Tax=Callinectes sapidus TaxID=6763 RepID=FARP_CALSI|nr:RecName: Full=FMRFamide-like neuropeptide [Callinectes sapidus]